MPLVNDNFASAIDLASATSGSDIETNVGATLETSEPQPSVTACVGTLWWKWTAPSAMRMQFDTLGSVTGGSTMDTVLAVYTGTSFADMVEVVSNDDGPIDSTSEVTFDALSSTVYWIQVGRYSSGVGTGDVHLSWRELVPPTNDNFVDAINLGSSLSGSTSGSNAAATLETGEPVPSAATLDASVWFKWTAPSNTAVIFSTLGSLIDTVLAVYTGTSFVDMVEVASNDDDPDGGVTSKVTFDAVSGTVYWIQVGVFAGNPGGTIALVWSTPGAPPPPPSNDNFASAIDLGTAPSGTSASTNVSATLEPGEPDAGFGGHTIWWRWVAPNGLTRARFGATGSRSYMVHVYTGPAGGGLASLTLVAHSGGSVDCDLVPTHTYWIRVDGVTATDQGAVTLAWSTYNECWKEIAGRSPDPDFLGTAFDFRFMYDVVPGAGYDGYAVGYFGPPSFSTFALWKFNLVTGVIDAAPYAPLDPGLGGGGVATIACNPAVPDTVFVVTDQLAAIGPGGPLVNIGPLLDGSDRVYTNRLDWLPDVGLVAFGTHVSGGYGLYLVDRSTGACTLLQARPSVGTRHRVETVDHVYWWTDVGGDLNCYSAAHGFLTTHVGGTFGAGIHGFNTFAPAQVLVVVDGDAGYRLYQVIAGAITRIDATLPCKFLVDAFDPIWSWDFLISDNEIQETGALWQFGRVPRWMINRVGFSAY